MSDTLGPRTTLKVIALAVAGAVGGFLFGFDSSVVNGAVDAVRKQFSLSASLTGLAVASALIGCAVGAYLAGRLADRFGRIPAMIVGAILFLASAIGSGLSIGVWDLVVWRLVGGLGIGIASVIAPAYIAEISPRQLRGRLASLQQLAITLGIFAALLSDTLTPRKECLRTWGGETARQQKRIFEWVAVRPSGALARSRMRQGATRPGVRALALNNYVLTSDVLKYWDGSRHRSLDAC